MHLLLNGHGLVELLLLSLSLSRRRSVHLLGDFLSGRNLPSAPCVDPGSLPVTPRDNSVHSQSL